MFEELKVVHGCKTLLYINNPRRRYVIEQAHSNSKIANIQDQPKEEKHGKQNTTYTLQKGASALHHNNRPLLKQSFHFENYKALGQK